MARREEARPRRARWRDDGGSGLVSAWFTLPVVLVFLLFATQLAFSMYTMSLVEGIAFDAANHVAGSDQRDHRDAARAAATAEADERASGLDIAWDWGDSDDEYVELGFVVENPTLLPDAFAGGFGFDEQRRTVRVRAEEPRS